MDALDPHLTDNDPWASALLGLALLRDGQDDAALERVDVLARGTSFDEVALRLWLTSELAVTPAGAARLERDRPLLDATVDRLAQDYHQPALNWMDLGVPGTYATRLALTYGALASYRNATNSRRAAGLIPAVREVFFREFLAGGRLRSRTGGDSLFTDIVLCAVPFGLIDAGNQILVESVAHIEAHQYRQGFAFSDDRVWLGGEARADLDGLMAWYFSEKGEGRRAQLLLEPWASGLAGQSPRARVLHILAAQSLARHAGSGDQGTQVLHSPAGHGSRYHPQDRNRSPVSPLVGDTVVVRAVVRPTEPDTVVRLEVEGAQAHPCLHVGNDGVEGHWEASLTGIDAPVRYRFVAQTSRGEGQSPWFSFRPGRRHDVVSVRDRGRGRVTLVTASGAEVTIPVAVAPAAGELVWSGGNFALVKDGRTLVRGWDRYGLAPIAVDLDADGQLQGLRLRLAVDPDEEFYGAGERYSTLGYRGHRLDCWVFNQYRDQGLKTYIPVPFWHSSAGWGLRVLGGGYSQTGFCDRLDGLVEVDVEAAPGVGFTFYSGRPWEVVRGYLNDVGLPSLPPRWVFGPWMSSNNWDNQALTLEQARLTAELGLPATVLVLEQWSDEATFYVFNDAVYDRKPGDQAFSLADFTFPAEGRWPDPKAMVQALHDQGLKVILWAAPKLKDMDGLPHAQRDEDERVMVDRGWCLKHADGRPYRIPDFEWFKRSLVPDFTHPGATEWWFAKRRYLFDEVGIDGVKTDGGEGVYGDDVVDFAGHRGDVLRNRYPVDYVGAFHRFVQGRTGGNGVTFSRAGFEGSQAFPAHWAGDERSTWEAFRNSLRAGLTSGLSGLPFWGWDLGGFNGDVPDAELYLRGVAMAAFCPLMQYHAESKGERNRDRTPWNIADRCGDPRVVPLYRKFAQARMNLLPYLWDEARYCASTGEALMRALWTAAPEDPALRRIDDEYLLGRSLLVAPVVWPGRHSRLVVFPAGQWVGLFDGQTVNGPTVLEVAAALDIVPVWFRAGAAVALNLPESGAFPGDVGNQCDGYTRLTFRLAPGVPVHVVYQTYDGQTVTLDGIPGSGLDLRAPFPVFTL